MSCGVKTSVKVCLLLVVLSLTVIRLQSSQVSVLALNMLFTIKTSENVCYTSTK